MTTRFTATLIACTLIVLTASCTRVGCKEAVESQANSPDGILVATSVVRDCGATTDFGTSVNLHRSDHGFGDPGGDIFVAAGRHRLNLKWVNADQLNIQCEDCSRKQISRAVTILGKTEIHFDLPAIAQHHVNISEGAYFDRLRDGLVGGEPRKKSRDQTVKKMAAIKGRHSVLCCKSCF